jgi:hypothetical protein
MGPTSDPETPHVQREVPYDPEEVDNILQEPGNYCREIFDDNPLRGSEKRAKDFAIPMARAYSSWQEGRKSRTVTP